MLPRVLQCHKHPLFKPRPTATDKYRLLLLNSTRYYPSLRPPFQTSVSSASTYPHALPLPQLATQYSPYSPSTGNTSHITPSGMATATKIDLSPVTDSGIYSSNVREDTARTASEILQDDMATHHVFFNDQHFHSMCFHAKSHQELCLMRRQITYRISSLVSMLLAQRQRISRLAMNGIKVTRDPSFQPVKMSFNLCMMSLNSRSTLGKKKITPISSLSSSMRSRQRASVGFWGSIYSPGTSERRT
jgi:hypothetical protein